MIKWIDFVSGVLKTIYRFRCKYKQTNKGEIVSCNFLGIIVPQYYLLHTTKDM